MHYIKLMGMSAYYQFLIFSRFKQAVFYTFFFPVFLFLVFNTLFGGDDPEFSYQLMTGVIGMLIASDGFFAIGPTIKQMYSSGFVKYINKVPIPTLIHFLSLILSRIFVLLLEVLCLIIIAYYVYQVKLTPTQVFDLIIGISLGLVSFSFIGMCLNFLDIKGTNEKSISSIIYFLMLFTSNAFYPTDLLNPQLASLSNLLPLNQILSSMRTGDPLNIVVMLFWCLFPICTFIILFKKFKYNR